MATNFYKYEGSYYEEGTHKKISDLASLQEYAKAGGKELSDYAPDSSWEKIANPDEIKNYDVKGQYGSTLYGTRKEAQIKPETEPIPSDQLENTMNGADPMNYVNTNDTSSLSNKVTEVAGKVFNSNQQAIDNLRAEQEKLIQRQKDLAAAQKDQAVEGIKSYLNADDATAALNQARDLFNVEENIKALSDIQQKIVGAQEALDMGLIYEENRPARMQLITGRTATLQKQGLATIGALQGTAAVIQGNLDLADAYAKSTIAAIKEDADRNISALITLLDMADSDLTDLTIEERKIVNERIAALEAEVESGEEDRDYVIDLMKNYPKAFLNGGVTLLDSKESALAKMLPTMAEDERRKFEDSLKSGSSSSGKLTEQETSEYKAQLLQLKEAGASYDEAIIAFGDVLDINYIQEIYGKQYKPGDAQDAVTNQYYNQFLNENGKLKEGYTVEIDPDNGRPIIKESDSSGSSGGFFGWIKGLFS